MLDRDLAELYGVETRALKQAVNRNKERFPEQFMFQLTENETQISLYEQMDYQKQATLSNHYRMDENCYIFAKTLMREG